MIKRSWFYRNGLFYTILAFVLLIHLCLLAIRLYQNMDLAKTPTPTTGPPIKVRLVPPEKSRIIERKQIVQSEDPASETKPKDSAYLSDKDRTFDRQTVAKKIDKFNEGAKGGAKSKPQPKKDISLSDLGANEKGFNPLKEANVAMKEKARKMLEEGTQSGNPNARGVSSTNDYVEDVPLGDLTYLNTVEYKYYGFFHRIRQKLEQFWGRSIQEKAESILKQGRKIASEENLITSLIVTLNEAGEIVDVAIKGSSGVQELDEAAVDSFNDAGPFPNPPKGLVKNGEVQIEWGFVVNT